MKNLAKPLAPNFKPLLRRMNGNLKVALVEAKGAEDMKVDVGYLNPEEVKAVAAYFLKRGWLAVGYKWVEAYDRHYGGNGVMKVKWVGEAGVAVDFKPVYAAEKVEAYLH